MQYGFFVPFLEETSEQQTGQPGNQRFMGRTWIGNPVRWPYGVAQHSFGFDERCAVPLQHRQQVDVPPLIKKNSGRKIVAYTTMASQRPSGVGMKLRPDRKLEGRCRLYVKSRSRCRDDFATRRSSLSCPGRLLSLLSEQMGSWLFSIQVLQCSRACPHVRFFCPPGSHGFPVQLFLDHAAGVPCKCR